MKQNEPKEKPQIKYQDLHQLSFLQNQNNYLTFNRFKLETYQQAKEPSPWLDTQRQQCFKRPICKENTTLFKMPARRSRVESYRTQTEIKKKGKFQENLTFFKLNSTFVEFSVKSKAKGNNLSAARVQKSRSSQVRSVLVKNRLDMVRRQNEEECVSKTPKIKFLQRKFRIREGTSCGVRFNFSHTNKQALKHETLLTLQSEQPQIGSIEIYKTIDKKVPIRPIHSKQLSSKWFQ